MSSVAASLAKAVDNATAAENPRDDAVRRILFFDGVCGLCNRTVDFVIVRDRRGEFLFAPLQGDTARSLLSPSDVANLNTVVLWVNGKTYRKSAAVVRILWRLNPGWRFLGTLLWLVPLPLRNLGYALIAWNRYRFFGKKETCRMPTPEERIRFLP